jgi:uncharacterized protein (DUF1697 family)
MIEKAWPERLGFSATTNVRSHESLRRLIERNPFKGFNDSSKSHLNATFLKAVPRVKMKFPIRPEKKAFQLLGLYGEAVCSVIDTSKTKTPELMNFLEKQFGKQITTRTWKTVHRILRKLAEQ